MHAGLEIDGFMVRISGETKSKDYKAMMESNTEARIKCVSRVSDRLWVTLYHDVSKFKFDSIRIMNDYIRNLQNYFDTVSLEKFDLKVDSYGTFYVDGPEFAKKFERAITEAAETFQKRERGFGGHSQWIFDWDADDEVFKVAKGSENSHSFVNAMIYFKRMPWNNDSTRAQKVNIMRMKRYSKREEIIQKDTIG
jgi:hypothetical protein